MKNPQGKTRPIDYPYEVYRSDRLPNWEWRVLKKYQRPDRESLNPLAIWHCAVKSPMTYGSWEYGDTYIKDITDISEAYRICPLCEGELSRHPAISRLDNTTEICSTCGIAEAAWQFSKKPLTELWEQALYQLPEQESK